MKKILLVLLVGLLTLSCEVKEVEKNENGMTKLGQKMKRLVKL